MRPIIKEVNAAPNGVSVKIQNSLRGLYFVHDDTAADKPVTTPSLQSNMKELVITANLTTTAQEKVVLIDAISVYDLQHFASSIGKKAKIQTGKSVFYVPFSVANVKLEGEVSFIDLMMNHDDANFVPFKIYADIAPVTSKTLFSYRTINIAENVNRNLNVNDDLAILFNGSVDRITRRYANGVAIDNSYTELRDDNHMNGYYLIDEHMSTTNKRIFNDKLLLSLADSSLNIKSLDMKVIKDTSVVVAKENQYLR